jgi:hypothetical protein
MQRLLAVLLVLLVAIVFGYLPFMIAIGKIHVQWFTPDASLRNYMGLIGGGVMGAAWITLPAVITWPRKKRLQGKG